MRNVLVAAAAALLASASALAQFQGPSAGEATTVELAKAARDDSIVTLTGNIVTRISDDDYMFRDSTGEVSVEIDHHVWRGQEVTPETKLRISGEVDHERRGVKIEVRSLEIVTGDASSDSGGFRQQ